MDASISNRGRRGLRHRLQRPVRYAVTALVAGALACSGDTTGPALQSPNELYWALRLNQHAINLALTAPYDTAQLSATAFTETGHPFVGGDSAVHYSGTDSSVTVNSTGLVTAHYTTDQTAVIASRTIQGITLTDTVFIQVTQTPPTAPLSTFSLQPAPGDSAKRSVDYIKFVYQYLEPTINPDNNPFAWPVIATNMEKDTICTANGCPLLVYYHSSDTLTAAIDRNTGVITANDTGHVTLTATTLAYGVARSDSVDFTIGYQVYASIALQLDSTAGKYRVLFNAPTHTIVGIGAVLNFVNISSRLLDLRFDHTDGVDTASALSIFGAIYPPKGAGNISPFGGLTFQYPFQYEGSDSAMAARRFPHAGVYRYYTTLLPSDTFSIVVQAQH